MQKKAILVLLLSISFQASALTLKEAIKNGLQISPELASAESEQRQAGSQYGIYKGSVFPTITAVGAGEKRKNSSSVSNANSFALTNRELYSTFVELEQPLYAGGAITSGLKLGRVEKEIAKQNYYSAKQNTVQSIISAFYEMAKSEQLLQAAEANEKILKSFLAVTKKYESIGRTRRMDGLQASANLKLSQVDTEKSRAKFYASQSSLASMIAVEDVSSLKAEDKFTIQPVTPMKLDEALQQATKNSPELVAKQLTVKKVEATNDLDFVQDKPTLSLTASTGFQASDRERLFDDISEYNAIGLGLRIPLFQGLRSFSRSKVHRETKYQAQKDLALTERDLRNDLRTSLYAIQTSYDRVVKTQGAFEEAQKALELANNGYSKGITSSQDVISFQRNRYEAEKLFVEIRFEYLNDLLSLRKHLGLDLEQAYVQ